MKYRSEIDGLRAIAVVPVILFHAGFDAFSGGFIGVDVFFVISGYLITTIIHTEIKEKRFSIIQFYERRARRILPALFFVSLVCIPFAWMWLLQGKYKDFSLSLIAVNLFSSNILFWLESGYFAPAAELKPLLHTWTLAVEEQFYLFFPLFLLLFKKLREYYLLILLTIIALISLELADYGTRNAPAASFYLLPTRAWELATGSILAISMPHWKRLKTGTALALSSTGMCMIIYSIFFFDETTPIPGYYGLLPVIGTALIIAFANNENAIGKTLGLKPVVGIGLISYSAYLWHQPLFAFARVRMLEGVSSELYIFLSLLSLALAYFTWKYIEAPFRNRKKFSRRQIFSASAAISALFISFGLVGYLNSGIPGRLPDDVIAYSSFARDTPPRTKECMHGPGEYKRPPQNECIYNSDSKLEAAIWGDSHAGAIADGLGNNLSTEDIGLLQLTYLACPPVTDYKRSDKVTQCNQFNTAALQYLKNSNIQTVVLLSRWTLYLEGKRFDNEEGGVEPGINVYGLPIVEDLGFIHNKNRVPAVGNLYRATITELLNAGKNVVLVYPIPEAGWNVPIYLAKIHLFNQAVQEPLSTSFDVFKKRSRNAYIQLDKLGEHKNLLRIYPEEIFCNSTLKGRCIIEQGGKPLYFDDNHPNSIGSNLLSKAIVSQLKEKHWIK